MQATIKKHEEEVKARSKNITITPIDSDDEDCEDGEDDEETEGLASISKQAKQARTKKTVSGDDSKSTGFSNQQALLLCGNVLLVTAFLHWQ